MSTVLVSVELLRTIADLGESRMGGLSSARGEWDGVALLQQLQAYATLVV